MKLLVGLGNPGTQYFNTRHNLGFMVTSALLQKYGDSTWQNEDKFHAVVSEITIHEHKITLMQPHTFMNNSGRAVASYAQYYKIDPRDIALVYDDVALPLGKMRVRTDGGAGGHNGVQSVIDSLNSDEFLRIRLGIGAESPLPLENFVLAPFTEAESLQVRELITQAVDAIEIIVEHGVDLYLSKHHQ